MPTLQLVYELVGHEVKRFWSPHTQRRIFSGLPHGGPMTVNHHHGGEDRGKPLCPIDLRPLAYDLRGRHLTEIMI